MAETDPDIPAVAPRSLWALMRTLSSTDEDCSPDPADVKSLESTDKPKGLWAVMNSPDRSSPDSAPSERLIESTNIAPTAATDIPSRLALTIEQPLVTAWSRRALTAGLCGIGTLLLALLSLWPGWLFRVPALLAGLIASWLGLLADSEVRRSHGRQRGRPLAWSGIGLGAMGMFLAPTLLARWGHEWRENVGREAISSRLRNIGQALERHHDQHGHYPAASLMSDGSANGAPLHGWMTPLLPHLGQAALFAQIDQGQPFDVPANQTPMQTIVPEFTIAGRLPNRNPRGFGLTHFAGVGGSDMREPAGLVHLGLFDERGTVRREAVSDGLSQTLIVGEIAADFPPWGQPGNIRAIGKGLNRQAHGFGNAAGTGAMFLHADGSARFYSKETDRHVLQQLETRDGGEAVK